MRYSILKNTETQDIYASFANWYSTLLTDFDIHRYPEVKAIFNEITKNEKNKDSIIKHTINYVKLKIRYIAIEDGINAFKPRNPSEVLNNKKGDCKDMAFLIMHVLRMNDIEAYVALIPSTGNKYDFNFPTLSSADHAICMVKTNDRWQVLDATDANVPYPLVSRHTQGKTAFIVKDKGYELYKIPITEAKKNRVHFKQEINITDSGFINTYDYKYKGYAITDFIIINDENDIKKRNFNTMVALENTTKNIVYMDAKLVDYDSLIQVTGKGVLHRSLFNLSDKKFFISTGFLPNPIQTNYTIDTDEHILLNETSSIVMESTIFFPEKIKLTNAKTIQYNGYPFKLKVSFAQSGDKKIKINYEYQLDKIILEKNDFTNYQIFCKELKSALNYVLAIE